MIIYGHDINPLFHDSREYPRSHPTGQQEEDYTCRWRREDDAEDSADGQTGDDAADFTVYWVHHFNTESVTGNLRVRNWAVHATSSLLWNQASI